MTTAVLLTSYFLIWPVISAGVLALLIIALVRDARNARRSGADMI